MKKIFSVTAPAITAGPVDALRIGVPSNKRWTLIDIRIGQDQLVTGLVTILINGQIIHGFAVGIEIRTYEIMDDLPGGTEILIQQGGSAAAVGFIAITIMVDEHESN